MHKFFLIFVLSQLFGTHVSYSKGLDTLIVYDDFETTNASKHISYHIDRTKQLQLSDVLEKSLLWTNHNKNRLSFGPEQAIHWLHFIVKNGSLVETDIVLNLEYAHLAKYQIHTVFQDSVRSENTQGDNLPFTERLTIHPHFIHHYAIPSQENIEFYIAFDQEGQDLPIPLSISSRKYFFETENNNRLIHGISFGLASLIIFGLIGLFFLSRKRFVLLQIIASIFSLFYVFAEEGYGFMYLWSDYPAMNGISRPLFLGIVTMFSLLFTIEFLGYAKHKSLYKAVISIILLYASYLIFAHPLFLLPLDSHELIGIIIIIFLILSFLLTVINVCLCIWKAITEKSNDAKLLLGVFGLTMIAIFLRTIAFRGGFTNVLTKHTGIITLTFQIAVIGLYLFYRFIQVIKENQNIKLTIANERQRASEAVVDSLHKERERVSMDIHDSLASLLSAARINLEALKAKYINISSEKEYKTASSLLVDISQEMRNISHNLMPKTLKTFGLIAEIKKHINAIQLDSKINITFEHFGFSERLPERIELELYYITMELLDNIFKYAQSSNILIQFIQYENEIISVIEDNGIGFLNSDIRKGANGLENIRNRVTWLNGKIDINSAKNEGTSVTINIPL